MSTPYQAIPTSDPATPPATTPSPEPSSNRLRPSRSLPVAYQAINSKTQNGQDTENKVVSEQHHGHQIQQYSESSTDTEMKHAAEPQMVLDYSTVGALPEDTQDFLRSPEVVGLLQYRLSPQSRLKPECVALPTLYASYTYNFDIAMQLINSKYIDVNGMVIGSETIQDTDQEKLKLWTQGSHILDLTINLNYQINKEINAALAEGDRLKAENARLHSRPSACFCWSCFDQNGSCTCPPLQYFFRPVFNTCWGNGPFDNGDHTAIWCGDNVPNINNPVIDNSRQYNCCDQPLKDTLWTVGYPLAGCWIDAAACILGFPVLSSSKPIYENYSSTRAVRTNQSRLDSLFKTRASCLQLIGKLVPQWKDKDYVKTKFIEAANKKDHLLVSTMLKHGVSPQSDFVKTEFINAVKRGVANNMIKAMLDNGLDPDTCDAAGNTALMCAAKIFEFSGTVELILGYKPNPLLRNNEGLTARDMAINHKKQEADVAADIGYYLRISHFLATLGTYYDLRAEGVSGAKYLRDLICYLPTFYRLPDAEKTHYQRIADLILGERIQGKTLKKDKPWHTLQTFISLDKAELDKTPGMLPVSKMQGRFPMAPLPIIGFNPTHPEGAPPAKQGLHPVETSHLLSIAKPIPLEDPFLKTTAVPKEHRALAKSAELQREYFRNLRQHQINTFVIIFRLRFRNFEEFYPVNPVNWTDLEGKTVIFPAFANFPKDIKMLIVEYLFPIDENSKRERLEKERKAEEEKQAAEDKRLSEKAASGTLQLEEPKVDAEKKAQNDQVLPEGNKAAGKEKQDKSQALVVKKDHKVKTETDVRELLFPQLFDAMSNPDTLRCAIALDRGSRCAETGTTYQVPGFLTQFEKSKGSASSKTVTTTASSVSGTSSSVPSTASSIQSSSALTVSPPSSSVITLLNTNPSTGTKKPRPTQGLPLLSAYQKSAADKISADPNFRTVITSHDIEIGRIFTPPNA